MAVAFRSSSNTGDDDNVSTISPAVPSGAAAGDVVVAFLSRWGAGLNPAVTTPTGFVHAGQYISGDDNAKIDVYWKRLAGPDTDSYTFSWGTPMWSSVEIGCFTGADSTGDPIAAVDSWRGSAGTFGDTTVAVDQAPGLAWNSYNDTGGQHAPPAGFTEVADANCGSLAYMIPGTAGTFTATGGTVTTSSPAAAVLVAVAPEPTAGSGLPLAGSTVSTSTTAGVLALAATLVLSGASESASNTAGSLTRDTPITLQLRGIAVSVSQTSTTGALQLKPAAVLPLAGAAVSTTITTLTATTVDLAQEVVDLAVTVDTVDLAAVAVDTVDAAAAVEPAPDLVFTVDTIDADATTKGT
jgi:hypothetical protein